MESKRFPLSWTWPHCCCPHSGQFQSVQDPSAVSASLSRLGHSCCKSLLIVLSCHNFCPRQRRFFRDSQTCLLGICRCKPPKEFICCSFSARPKWYSVMVHLLKGSRFLRWLFIYLGATCQWCLMLLLAGSWDMGCQGIELGCKACAPALWATTPALSGFMV